MQPEHETPLGRGDEGQGRDEQRLQGRLLQAGQQVCWKTDACA